MFSKFSQQIRTIFLDTDSQRFSIDEKINIILSPSLYWVKKVSLPLKYIREVKPLLPSLFEDILPEGNYNYTAYRTGKDFFIFAYEDKVILDTLKEKGVNPLQVVNVYFAQCELSHIENALKIDENQSIYKKDEILVLLPSQWMDSNEYIDVSGITLSKHSITLSQFGHIVQDKNIYMLISVLSLFIIIALLEYFIVHQKITQTVELRDELFIKSELKPTMIQNRSILNEYRALHDRQMKLRAYIAYILSLSLEKNEKISSINLKGQKLIVEFSGVDQGSEGRISKLLSTNGMKFISKFQTNEWNVEISL